MLSSMLGKKPKSSATPQDGGSNSPKSGLATPLAASRSTTPTPGNNRDRGDVSTDSDEGDSTLNLTLSSEDKDNAAGKQGTLTIRVMLAEGLTLPSSKEVPKAIRDALASEEGRQAQDVSVGSVSQSYQRLGLASLTAPSTLQTPSSPNTMGHMKRASVQRKNAWFMPCLVLEYDVNQVLVDALGGSDLYNPVYMYQTQFDVTRLTAQISIQIYLRNLSSTPTAPPKNKRHSELLELGMGNDIFLGGIKFTPDLNASSEKGGDSDPATNPNGEARSDKWYEVKGGDGKIKIGWGFKAEQKSLSIDDFELLKVIGKGSFGKVMQVRKKSTSRIYALKTLRKSHIAARNEITHTLAERFVLSRISSPFIVPLKFSFQSEAKLYLVLSFVNGGELFHHLQQEGRFSEERSRFYAGELLLALEHLHGFGVVYRDLKPENILLDWTGHLALCDFGLCKLDMTGDKTTSTFCGTPEYLSPEIILGHAYTKAIDWWTLGILLFEMMSGLPPFFDENTDKMYEKIVRNPLTFSDVFGSEAKAILKGLLTRDPATRLGSKGADEIRKHPFFAKHIDFKALGEKRVVPPFKPNVTSAIDTANFDVVFTSEPAYDSVVEGGQLSETVQARFKDFPWNGSNLSPR